MFQHTYIGANDIAKETVWIWSDGTEMKPLFWMPGQPDNNIDLRGEREDCLALWRRKGFSWDQTWNDLPCNWKQHFICKYKEGTYKGYFVKRCVT